MQILSIGLSHTSASINLRERINFGEEQIRASLSRLSCGHLSGNMVEMVILSTCNRIEIYAISSQESFTELEIFLSEARGVARHEFIPHLHHHKGLDAARHLFKVSAGLDSLVVGEPQILGQVTRALELARGQNTAGPILNRLFQSAIHAGKRARTETAISRNPASVSSLAASLSARTVHRFSESQIVILGAGEMAELAVEAMRKRGANRILVVNRTLERAHTLAQRWDAQATTFENINAALTSADILIASTGAPHTLISHEMVKDAMIQRAGRPLVLIDIAVPRDIDPETANIPHVRLYDMDGLSAQLEHSLAERMAEVPQVKNILDEELKQFGDYLKSLEMLPIIADMRQNAEAIRQAELEKTLRRLPGLTDAERTRIEAMTQALVKKILDAPTQRLHAEASCPHAPEYAAVARTLFGLHKGDGLCGFSGNACPIPTASD
jgi:glutamyl-tRNA reductase